MSYYLLNTRLIILFTSGLRKRRRNLTVTTTLSLSTRATSQTESQLCERSRLNDLLQKRSGVPRTSHLNTGMNLSLSTTDGTASVGSSNVAIAKRECQRYLPFELFIDLGNE